MDIFDKIGRDEAKRMLDMLESVHRGDPDRIAILQNTRMYKFLSGKSKGTYTHSPMTGPNAGIPKKVNYVMKIDRSASADKIMLPIGLQQLKDDRKVTQDEAESIQQMLDSPDPENHKMAEMVIETARTRRRKDGPEKNQT